MKKTSLFISVMITGIICLTSCLGNGGNKQTGNAYGVLTATGISYTTMILNSTSELGPVSSPQLSEWVNAGDMKPDKCYSFKFEVDFDHSENSYAALQVNGYYTVKIIDYTELPTSQANSYLTDTAKPLEDEVPVSNGYVAGSYAAGYMYVQQTANHPSDQNLEWEMSYDYSIVTNPTTVNGIRYYDLFVRARKAEGGTKPNKDASYLNAYYMSNFFNLVAVNEKMLLGVNYDPSASTFKFRIFYVKEINDDVLTWQNTSQEVYIAPFAEEETYTY
jgi:hypothetical protein